MTVKAGDCVTWQSGHINGNKPLGMTGCKVLELSEMEGRQVAKLDLGRFNPPDGGDVWAYADDLHPE